MRRGDQAPLFTSPLVSFQPTEGPYLYSTQVIGLVSCRRGRHWGLEGSRNKWGQMYRWVSFKPTGVSKVFFPPTYFHSPSILCHIFMFHNELTAQWKLLVIAVPHCRVLVTDRVVLNEIHQGLEANFFINPEQTGKHVDCTLSINRLSVKSWSTTWFREVSSYIFLRGADAAAFPTWQIFFEQQNLWILLLEK